MSLENTVYAVRDNIYSIANLRQIGIEDEIALVPDDLYFLHEQLSDRKPNICIQLPERYIVLELYSSLDEIKEKLEEINTFINLMNKRYGLKVVFISLDKGFGGEKQGEILAELHDIIVWDFNNGIYRKIEDVLYIVRHSQFVLCQRYHLFLFSIANNIPAYQILKNVCGDKRYYYAKSNGLLKQVFCNQKYKQYDYFAHDLIEGLHRIVNDFKSIVQMQLSRFNHKKEIAERQMEQRRRKYIEKNMR